MRNIFKIIFLIIGAFIGAGFASGKEVFVFFNVYGSQGIIGLIISCVMLFIVLYKTLNIVLKNNINNYKDFLKYIFLKNLDKSKSQFIDIINNVVNILLLISFFVMVAGFGAYLEQEYNLKSIIGSWILAILCYIVLSKGTKGLVKVNESLVPIIVIVIIIIGRYCIKPSEIFYKLANTTNVYKVIISGIVYCSYNCILLISILTTVKEYIKNKMSVICISTIAVVIITLLLLIMYFVLDIGYINFENIEMPVAHILQNHQILKGFYGVIVLASIFTTAVSLGNSFIKNIVKKDTGYTQYVIIMCITSVGMSQFGFSNLVNLLYPIFGYIGLIQIIKLLVAK